MARDGIFESLEDGQRYRSRVARNQEAYDVSAAGLEARVVRAEDGSWLVTTATGCVVAGVAFRESEIEVSIGHERFRFRSLDGRYSGATRSAATGRAEVKAPMPGKVIKLLAEVGERVEAGQGILLFEAMKMQNEIRSPRGGVLSAVQVEPGQPVVAHEHLFVVEADE